MQRIISCIIIVFAILAVRVQADTFEELSANGWRQWRGPKATGVAPHAKPPLQWSETKNVLWKKPIDGAGLSTPIVWGDKVFLLTAINTGEVDPSLPRPEDQPKRVFGIKHPNTKYEFVVLCLSRSTGEEIWRQTATRRVPHEGTHGDNNFASASPITDGERLYCWFGSAGLYCYDLGGKELWQRDLGNVKMGASLGEGCSPVVHDGKVIVLRDHAGPSYIEVLNAKNGETLWKKDRKEGNGWATPRVVEYEGKTQVITSGTTFIRSYDLNTGDIIWKCSGLTSNPIPAPVIHNDVVFCMTGYKGYSLLAIPLSATGDITGTDKIKWSLRRGTPYTPSPLLYDGLLYFTQSNQAILSCVNADNGEIYIDRERLGDLANMYASPVAANGRVYLMGRNGVTLVVKHGKEFKTLATNKLEERIDASPAIAGNQIFIRGARSLYCIAEKQ